MPAGSGFALAVLAAREESLNSVIVEFSNPVRASDPGDVRDALDPYNWTLTVRNPFGARVRLVQSVERIDDEHVRVLLDGELTANTTYRLTIAPTVQSLTGGLVSPTCGYADFDTFAPPRFRLPEAARDGQMVDVANPWVPGDALTPTSPLGTYQIADTGDWANDSDRVNLRKRVLRRATTWTSAFFHLAGYGVEQRLKALIRTPTLVQIQNGLQGQIKKEPDVLSVTVEVSQKVTAQGTILREVIRIQDRYGRADEIVAEIPITPPTTGS